MAIGILFYLHLMDLKESKILGKNIILSVILPAAFIFVLLMIKIIETFLDVDFTSLGIYPRTKEGLTGILTSPLIHGNWEHLINNALPLLILAWTLNYFYNQISIKVFLSIYFISGIFVWIFARGGAYHLGASGIIYGLVAFLMLSGVIRKNIHLLAITLLVTFLYGYLVWGIFPYKEEVSWESHMSGAMLGLILAVIFRNQGPPSDPEIYDEDEPIDNETDMNMNENET